MVLLKADEPRAKACRKQRWFRQSFMDCAISLFGRGGEKGCRLKDQAAALACCLEVVEQLKAFDEPSDAKNANDN